MVDQEPGRGRYGKLPLRKRIKRFIMDPSKLAWYAFVLLVCFLTAKLAAKLGGI